MVHPLLLTIIPLTSKSLLAARLARRSPPGGSSALITLATGSTGLLLLGPPLVVVATFVARHAFVLLPTATAPACCR
jgi:glucose-6-phosphate-specific signal transduction histidine kinase